jgi:hypothetical protein
VRLLALKYGLIGALFWISLKLAIFFVGKSISWFDFSVLSNNFVLLTAISLSIFFTKRLENFQEGSWAADIKAGVFGGMIYAVIVVSFGYFYNAMIDPSVIEFKINQRIDQLELTISTEEGLKDFQNRFEETRGLSVSEILESERKKSEQFLNPRVGSLLLLMLFTLLSLIYSFFITLVIRKIYVKGLS